MKKPKENHEGETWRKFLSRKKQVDVPGYAVMACLRTCHVTREDAATLTNEANQLGAGLVGHYEYGWILRPAEMMSSNGFELLSPEFQILLSKLSEAGIFYLALDSSGDCISNLPQFSW